MLTTVAPAGLRSRRLLAVLAVALAVTAPTSPARAFLDPRAAIPTGGTSPAWAGARSVPTGSEVRRPGFVLPVHRPVVDRFRRPDTPWGPGNRGWEFHTLAGDPVVAVGPGDVRFAGHVAGRLAVTIAHDGGLLSSVTGLAVIHVQIGQLVGPGTVLGEALPGLHLGFRLGGRYLDPADVYGSGSHAVLVPVPR